VTRDQRVLPATAGCSAEDLAHPPIEVEVGVADGVGALALRRFMGPYGGSQGDQPVVAIGPGGEVSVESSIVHAFTLSKFLD
jgi:hypothetical protein